MTREGERALDLFDVEAHRCRSAAWLAKGKQDLISDGSMQLIIA
jgi:hypothetical protein